MQITGEINVQEEEESPTLHKFISTEVWTLT